MTRLYGVNKAAEVGVTVTISILVVTNLIGNTLVILIILTNKSMKSPMNYLLLNLAVADIVVGLFMWPPFIFSFFFVHPNGLAGNLMCKLLTGGNLKWIGAVASVAFLVAVSVERYSAIIRPTSTRLKLNMRNVRYIVLACWAFSLVQNFPILLTVTYDQEIAFCTEQWPKQQLWLGSAYSTLWLGFVGIMPITIMIVLYSRVIYTLWFKRSEHQVQGTQLAMLKSRKRVTKIVVIISVIYAVCWLPDSVIYVLYHYQIRYNYGFDLPSIFGIILVTCNSAINPFIYTFQSEEFKRHLKGLLCSKNRVPVKNDRDSMETAPKSNSRAK